MSYSPTSSKITFVVIAALIASASLACWQFYQYATFKHDNGLLNIEGGRSHLAWALFLAFIACGLGFVIATTRLRNEVDQLHITSWPSRRDSSSK